MAVRAKNLGPSNWLQQALAQLVQSQAQLAALQVQLAAQQAQSAAQHAAWMQEFRAFEKAVEKRFLRIEALLLEHERILGELPEVIRKKIGYQRPT